jgi:16S rRNA (cytidine1402-2'-O)-methyltransferase
VILFVVGTPIGNLDDLSVRALATLREVAIVAAEDTRRTRALLTHFGIAGKTLIALHAHSSAHEVERLVERLQAGEKVALVTDAGTPTVSDPGDALVRGAIAAGIRVVPIPGPSAPVAALSASGLASGSGFRFAGFLPRTGVARAEAIASICATTEPVVLFESPERVQQTLGELAALTPDRSVCVARELTKMHEELVRGTLAELTADREWLGEITIVLGAFERPVETIGDDAIDARIDEELARGTHSKVAAQRVAAWSGRPQREIYARVVARKQRTT